ncbi:hemerythrin [Candidatus Daviesbacteria bacterium RIFOXYD1_FULL_41_10]|uniref:Hemerythrin n=3 Tax=Patescibacteria group TaxID=1783273 RepID=A0A1F5MZE7_9BACT|nr:MAG: Cytoplasmic protein [Candidatus Daviesbacteria bacterium GW2011_GWB1_41_5]KKT80753.1 MAG: Cytoplasmic protein [Candidatus Azambacteria bacterium GW2011_GWA1_44_9]OGE70735.1 MAG: hemerythrin [Candidatus Daviesbacteria bacterium RIFOXYD1_FULL_41_10]
MTATGQLKEEHKAVKEALQILHVFAQNLKAGKKVDKADFEKLLEFLKVFVDKCHHGKEENLLFPAMEKAGIPKEGGPIGMMLYEHSLGRNFIKGMGSAKTGRKIADNIEGYCQLLTEHIDKEDNILYEMADMHLDKATQRELLKKFDLLEKEKIGPGKHEKFHQTLNKLKKVYPLPKV